LILGYFWVILNILAFSLPMIALYSTIFLSLGDLIYIVQIAATVS
jgi:hypothetical protein